MRVICMTENKRYSEQNLENHLNRIYDNHECKVIFDEEIVDLLNEQEERIKELETEQNKVQEVLTDYFNRYTQMAVELRHDKYGNGVCHDVTEVIMEIADKLDINIIDDGDVE